MYNSTQENIMGYDIIKNKAAFLSRTKTLTDLLGGALIQSLSWVPPNGLVIVSASDIYYQVVMMMR